MKWSSCPAVLEKQGAMFGMFTRSTKPSIVVHVWLCVKVCVSPCGFNACVCVGTISEEREELQRLHSCRGDEQEGVVLRLRSQLRDTHDELDQVRISLRTLEGADGHG